MFFKWSTSRPFLSAEKKREIYELYFDRVYRTALSIARDPCAAEEITQETFTVAFEKYQQLKDSNKTGAWLSAIALNVARAFFNQKKKVVYMEPEILNINREQNEFGGFEEIIERKETERELKDVIFRLPIEFQEIIILKYYDELEVAEIAQILELPIGTVKSRLSRGREKIRRILETGDYYGLRFNEGGSRNAK